jgi:hypothetical protein
MCILRSVLYVIKVYVFGILAFFVPPLVILLIVGMSVPFFLAVASAGWAVINWLLFWFSHEHKIHDAAVFFSIASVVCWAGGFTLIWLFTDMLMAMRRWVGSPPKSEPAPSEFDPVPSLPLGNTSLSQNRRRIARSRA